MIISIDVGMRSNTCVLMMNQRIVYNRTDDLQAKGKDLPNIISILKGICDDLNEQCIQRTEVGPSIVLVEKQIGRFSFAQIESAIYMYFSTKGIPVVQVNPRDKLKVQIDNSCIEKGKFKKKYDQNKYEAKQLLDAFLTNTQQTVQVENKFKKDLADAVLQCLYYTNKQQQV